jgi:hypothetical protein
VTRFDGGEPVSLYVVMRECLELVSLHNRYWFNYEEPYCYTNFRIPLNSARLPGCDRGVDRDCYWKNEPYTYLTTNDQRELDWIELAHRETCSELHDEISERVSPHFSISATGPALNEVTGLVEITAEGDDFEPEFPRVVLTSVPTSTPTTPSAFPTTAEPTSSPTITPVPSASPAPTKECLTDEFDGSSIVPEWTDDTDGDDGSYVVADGAITFSDTSHVRSVRSFATPLIIRATLDKTGRCPNHYIKLSTGPWELGGSSWYEPGVVTFRWGCDDRYIYGQTDSTFTNCAKERMYDIKITVDGSKVTWSDADGACDELVLQDTIGSSSEHLYVYVGAVASDSRYNYATATWHSVEICRRSLLTTASPTASPSLASPIPKRRSEAEATLIVAVAVGLSFAVVACALFIGIRRKLRRSRKPANVPITSSPAAAEAQAPSVAARLRLEAEPEQLEQAGPALE